MFKFVLFLSVFVGQYAFAQTQKMIELHNRVLRESGNACSILQNPHSYPCTDWTYKGNGVFPLIAMNWNALQGKWAMVTYADPVGNQNSGPEFEMLKKLGQNTVPAGVFDFASRKVVGEMDIIGTTIQFKNWQNQRMSTIPDAFVIIGDVTAQLQAIDKNGSVHLFNCRDFIRENTHHLLCSWDKRSGNSDFVHQGYIGFLRTANQ